MKAYWKAYWREYFTIRRSIRESVADALAIQSFFAKPRHDSEAKAEITRLIGEFQQVAQAA
jgi:hypothetical protein